MTTSRFTIDDAKCQSERIKNIVKSKKHRSANICKILNNTMKNRVRLTRVKTWPYACQNGAQNSSKAPTVSQRWGPGMPKTNISPEAVLDAVPPGASGTPSGVLMGWQWVGTRRQNWWDLAFTICLNFFVFQLACLSWFLFVVFLLTVSHVLLLY